MAGRVRSVAAASQVADQREKEIKDFVPRSTELDACFEKRRRRPLPGQMHCGKDGKMSPTSQEEVSAIQAEVQDLPFSPSRALKHG